MRILSIYYTDKPGGFCKRLYRLLSAIADAGHQVDYLSLDTPPAHLTAKATFIRIPFPFKGRSGLLFWAFFSIWTPIFVAWISFKRKPAKLIVFGAYYAAISAPGKWLTGAKTTLFIRSLVFEINKITKKPLPARILSNLLEKFGLTCADRVVAMSASMKEALKRHFLTSREIEVLPNDVPEKSNRATIDAPPLEVAQLLKQKKILLLISGVFDERKNLFYVLRALTTYMKQHPHHLFELLIAGSGPELAKAQIWVREQKLSCVTFLGWLSSLEPLLPHVSLVIHPSLHEGMPNSVLEAWSFNIPTLLASTSELREMATNPILWLDISIESDLVAKLERISQDSSYLEELRSAVLSCRKPLSFNWDEKAIVIALDY